MRPVTGVDPILRIAADYLVGGVVACPVDRADDRLYRIGQAAYHASVWSEGRVGDLFDLRFREMVKTNLFGLTPQSPGARSQEILTKATKLLEILVPQLARSALSHVHLIVIAKRGTGFLSVSHPDVLGTIFLSPQVIQDPWQAAEFLLHEAMHQKFIDLEHTHSLLCKGYYDLASPTVRPLWNSPGRKKADEWSIGRCLTVMHVYTCLAVFFSCVERKASELGEQVGVMPGYDATIQCRRALDRAQYLRHRIGQHVGSLGVAGRMFVDWIGSLLDEFDPLPPPTERIGHLLLDRYVREADYLKERLAALEDTSGYDFNQNMLLSKDEGEAIAGNEVATAEQILSSSGLASPQSLAASVVSEFSGSAVQKLISTKYNIFRSLVSSMGRPFYYESLPPLLAENCDSLLENMIERSSQQLNYVLAQLPAATDPS